jgi:drug/metabolite transporter (DMT)-like permease
MRWAQVLSPGTSNASLALYRSVTHAPASLPPNVALSILALGALGTSIAYVLNYGLVRDAGATVTYVIPLFSTVAGVIFLGEGLSWNQPIGALVAIAGVTLSQGRLRMTAWRAT